MANKNFIVQNGLDVGEILTGNNIDITDEYPSIRPSLNLDFAKSRTLDPRITFTRASKASYYDSDGLLKLADNSKARFDHDPVTGESKGLLIEESRTNLLQYSENFENSAWGKNNANITPNTTTAPDGTVTADKIIENTTNNQHSTAVAYSATNTYLTFSVFAKAAERPSVTLQISNNTTEGPWASFNLSNGTFANATAQTDFSFVTAGMLSAGNGWYRCWITVYKNAVNTTAWPYISINNGSAFTYTGDGTSGIYIWGAQLEVGSFPTSYIPSTDTFTSRASTATYIGSDGLIKSAAINEARYNYNPTNLGLAPKLLLEESRTNLLTYSEQFNFSAAWSQTVDADTTVVSTSTTSPDGTTNASKIISATTNSNVRSILQTPSTATPASIFTASVYAKAAEYTSIVVYVYNGSDALSGVFDLTGSLNPSTTQAGIAYAINVSQENIGNGWYRCSVTGFVNNTTPSPIFRIYIKPSYGSSATFTGTIDSGVHIYGAQLEAANYTTIRSNTLQAGSSNTAVVLDTGASTKNDVYNGNRILISGEYRLITAYNGTTKVATLNAALTSAPAAGTTYTIDYTYTIGPTSYIPTTTTALTRSADVSTSSASVRQADSCVVQGSEFLNIYNQNEGTLICESSLASVRSVSNYFPSPVTLITDLANRLTLYYDQTSNSLKLSISKNNSFSVDLNSTITPTTNVNNTFAFSYMENLVDFNVDGGTVLSDTSALIPTVSKMTIGAIGSLHYLNGHISKLVYYPERLNNTILQNLTK